MDILNRFLGINYTEDMKPTKNKVFCKNCERTKMLFETEKKAENFMKFNKEQIEEESGYSPQRSYYCLFCGGWHLTSMSEYIGISKKEQLFEQYKQEKNKAIKIVNEEETIIKKNSNAENQERRKIIMEDLEGQIKEMETPEKEKFFFEKINMLNNEINLLNNSNISNDIEELKNLRQTLQILYILRKQNGIPKNNIGVNELSEKELEEWKLWAEKNRTDYKN